MWQIPNHRRFSNILLFLYIRHFVREQRLKTGHFPQYSYYNPAPKSCGVQKFCFPAASQL